MNVIKLLMIVFLGFSTGCAAVGDRESAQQFDRSVRVAQVDDHSWAIRFTRLEVWRSHGLLSLPRKAPMESWLDVEHRTGFTDVARMRYAALPEVRTPFAKRSLPFRGGVTLTENTVSVSIFYSPDGKSWQPFEYNGEYRIENM